MDAPRNTSSSLWEHTAPSLPALLLHIPVCCSESHSCRLSELRGLFLALFMAWTACDSQQCCCTLLGDAASHSLSEAKLFQHWHRLQSSSMTPKPTLFLLECMHSYVPELTQRSVFSFSKMSQFSMQWHDPEGVSSGCLAQLFKHSARPKLTQQITLLLLRC